MNDRARKAAVVGTVCATSMVLAALLGCAGTAMPSDGEDAEPTYRELVAKYPNEYNSSMVHKSDASGVDNSHAGFQELMETPAIRDVSGAILEVVDFDDPDKTDVDMKCVACKSSRFVDAYEENGIETFTAMILDEENTAFMDGQYWDCYSCHVQENGSWVVRPGAAYADERVFPKVANFFDGLNPKEVVCGQCHNTVSSRAYVKTQEDLESYDPYRYGYGFDERYRAMVEDGMYSVDEATGIKLVTMNHPQIEMFQDSIHQSMGLTCVDCHMNEAEDGEGNAYTSHDASSRPSEDDSAMEGCLTCHRKQSGLDTADDMRSFLKDQQDSQAQRQTEVEAGMSKLYGDILEEVQSGSIDGDALEQAKEKYSLAKWYVSEQQQNLIDPAEGTQIAHNPDLMRNLLERANVLVEEGEALLA